MKQPSLLIPMFVALVALPAMAAPRSYTGTAITENFDGLGISGTVITPLAGWDAGNFNPPQGNQPGPGNGITTVTDATLVVDDGTLCLANGTSSIVNLGTTSNSDRALGGMPKSATQDLFHQLAITNDSGSPITSLVLSYTGEQWASSPSGNADYLSVWFSDNSASSGFVTMGSTFTFTAPQLGKSTKLDGNAAANRTLISGTFTPGSPIPPGNTFYIRWYDRNDTDQDHALAIDDLTVTPVTSSDATVALGLTGSPLAEAAGVATVTATLSAVCANDVTVNLAFSGTATQTTDYTPSATSILIPANSLSASMTLTAVQDSLFESPDETIVVDISTVVNAIENGAQQVTATITDDDPAPPGIRYDSVSSQSAGAVSTITWSHTVGTGTNRMLVVGVATESNTDYATTSVTYGAQTMTLVPASRAAQSSPFNVTELWYLPAPAVGTATITITLAGALSNGAECGAVSLFGVQQVGPEAVAIANAAGSGSSYSLPITTLTDGAWLVDVVNNGSGNTAFTTTTTGMIERWDRNTGGQMVGAGATREVATAGTVTDTWTATGTSRKAQSIAAFAPVLAPMTSASNGDWHTPVTWDTLTVPVSASPVTVNANAITITSAAAVCNTLTLSSGGSVSATGQSLTLAGGSAGALDTTGGTLALDGASTLTLAKTNTAAGLAGLTVSSGTILNVTGELTVDANKDLSGATLSTPKLTLAGGTLTKSDGLAIAGGGLISGTGTVAGTVAVASGGKASPGTDTTIDTLHTSGLTLDNGSLLTLNAASTASLDQITVSTSGGLTINGGAITLLNGTGSGPAAGLGTYNLIAYSGPILGAGVSSLTVANPVPGTRYSFGISGGYVTLDLVQGPLWSGTDGGLWSAPANWSGATPTAADTLVYAAGGTSGSSVNDLTGTSFPSIQFESGVNAFTLSGNKVILTGDLTGAAVVNHSANLQTLNLPIEINAALAVNTASGAVTLGGAVSGTGTLIKNGTNVLTLSGNNLHGGTTLNAGTLNLNSAGAAGTGTLTIAGGTINNNSAGAVTLANSNPQNWNANFTFTGTQDLNLGTGAVTLGANCTATIAAKTLTVGGTISGSGRTLTKQGAGTLVISSAGSSFAILAPGNSTVGGSVVMDDSVVANPSLTLTGGINQFRNNDGISPTRFKMTAGTLSLGGDFRLSQDGTYSISTITGGTVNHTAGSVQVSFNSGVATFNVGGTAIYNGAGRTLDMANAYICNAYANFYGTSAATFGAINIATSNGAGSGQYGMINLMDTASLTGTSMQVGVNQNTATNLGVATINQDAGTLTINGNVSLAVTAPAGAPLSLLGSYNLYGGTLKARKLNTGTGNSGTPRLNFHGGTLTYNDTVAQTDFIALGTNGAAYIYEGATIDTAGQNVTISQPLLAPTGSGVTSIPVTAGGANQFVPGAVRIVRNAADTTGIGATATAVVDPATGVMTSIRITNPGTGYTLPPTVTLDRGQGTAATLGTVTIGANAYTGGLTKKGAGTLTLAGANTYTGPTTVEAGILAVNGSSIPNTGKLVISGGKVQATGTVTVDTLFFGTTPKAVGTWGATDSGAANIDDDHFFGTAGVVNVLNLGVGDDYQTWTGDYPGFDLTDPAADLDHDGMNNQQEYAFGLNPTSGASVNPIVVQLDKTSGLFSYTRRNPALTGLGYAVLTSADLLSWTPDVGGSQTPDSPSAETQTVTVHVGNPPLGGKLFVRVQAQ